MDNNSRQYTAYPTSPLTNNNSSQYYNNANQYKNNSLVVPASSQPLVPTQQLTTTRQYNTYTGRHQYQPPQYQQQQAPLILNSPAPPQIISRGTVVHDNRKLLAPIREEYIVSKYNQIDFLIILPEIILNI